MNSEQNLHKGHRERMREAYRRQGLPAEPHKQLEMLLFFALPRIDTNKMAHRLINRFGSLSGVLEAETYALAEVEGVGAGVAEFVRFMGDIAREYRAEPPARPGLPLDTEERAEAFVRNRLGGQKAECVLLAYLDAKGRLIHESLAKDAALSSVRVESSLRLTVKTAIQYHAAGVLVGHNHPNGTPMPSKKDAAEAKRLKDALRFIGVGLTDFIVLGEGGETYSLTRGGLLI